MTPERLAEQICGDLVHRVITRGPRSYLVTTFTYPDGDLVPLYVEGDERESQLTDRGTTLLKCMADGIDVQARGRRDLIDAVCATHGVRFENNALVKVLRPGMIGSDTMTFLQAVKQIATLQFHRTGKGSSLLTDRVGYELERRVRPFRAVERNFVYPDVPNGNAFPVEYKIGRGEGSRHIFTVTTAVKGNEVVGTTEYLRGRGHRSPTMAIVGEENTLRRKDLTKLRSSVDQVVIGLNPHRAEIVEFALAAAA